MLYLIKTYDMNRWMDLNEAVRKLSLDIHLEMITFWSQSSSRWLLQLIRLSQLQKGHTSVGFTSINIKCNVVVAEGRPQHILT